MTASARVGTLSQNGYGDRHHSELVCFAMSGILQPATQRRIIGCQSHSQCYARGHCSLLRPTFPPLRTPHGFACSVASLSRCPCHYRPGRCNFRRAALVERPLGQGKPSTQLAGHNADCCTPATTPHLGDRKAWPLPGAQPAKLKVPHLAALALSMIVFLLVALAASCARPARRAPAPPVAFQKTPKSPQIGRVSSV